MTLLKNFCTRHWVGPRKSASNRAPHLLRPALNEISRKSNLNRITCCDGSFTVFTPINCSVI